MLKRCLHPLICSLLHALQLVAQVLVAHDPLIMITALLCEPVDMSSMHSWQLQLQSIDCNCLVLACTVTQSCANSSVYLVAHIQQSEVLNLRIMVLA